MRGFPRRKEASIRALTDIAHATAFLTRLPVPARLFGDRRLDFARQCWAFPIVGAFVAIVGAALGLFTAFATGSSWMAALVTIGATVVATGGLHEDGTADCADGFWGGHDRARRLEIMRDSSVGTYGVLALIFVVGLRVVAVERLYVHGDTIAVMLAMIAAAAFGRTALLWHWIALKSARTPTDGKDESLASRFGVPGQDQAILASAILALPLLVLLLAMPGWAVPVAFFCGTAVAIAVSAVARSKIGGCTGDTLGATALLSETAFLCAALAPTSAP